MYILVKVFKNTTETCYGSVVKNKLLVFVVAGSNPAMAPFFFEILMQIKHIVSSNFSFSIFTSQKAYTKLYNSFTSQKTEKMPDFSKFAIVFKLQPLQHRIFSPLQQHHSLPFAVRKYRLDAPRI